ncbi:type II secretion system F family protein [soil metagenome]
METLLIPLMVAAAVGLAVWAFVALTSDPERKEKKKLAERLSMDQKVDNNSGMHRSITHQMEAQGLPAGMIGNKFMQSLHRKVIQAYPEGSLRKFLMYVSIGAFVCGLISAMIFPNWYIVGIGTLIGGYVPFFVLNSKRSRRQKSMVLQLPDALDFLSRILRAGHSLSTGVQMMGEELPMPLSTEFRRAYDQHSLGQPMEDAFKDMATRIESTDFAFFVTAVLIQRQTGGDLSEVLSNISSMIRGRIRLMQHVKSKTAEGRFTGYILVAFPAVMFVIVNALNPDYGNILLHTTGGLYMLGTAFGLQMLGLFAIRKVTTVRV